MVLPSNSMEGKTVFHLSVANGVRQGGILSPILFTVYIDELLQRLTNIGVGCHWKGMFAGCLCYADDLALLASFAHALRRINVDSLFWFCYGEKSDVQCRKDPINLFSSSQIHCGWWLHRILLNFSDSVCCHVTYQTLRWKRKNSFNVLISWGDVWLLFCKLCTGISWVLRSVAW